MYDIMKNKMSGLNRQLDSFIKRFEKLNSKKYDKIVDFISSEMKKLGYSQIDVDDMGNIIAKIEGSGEGPGMMSLSHMLCQEEEGGQRNYFSNDHKKTLGDNVWKHCIASSIFSGALLNRSLIPFNGDLFIVCFPRTRHSAFGIERLFEDKKAGLFSNVKGAILSEPTSCNVFIGHKGKIEYEIVINGIMTDSFLNSQGVNMLGTMFPLVSELEKVAASLPSNSRLGQSHLKIRSISYKSIPDTSSKREFTIRVDRQYIPEENTFDILKRAKKIGSKVYCGQKEVKVKTSLVKERIRTSNGKKIITFKKNDSWMIESHHPFVLDALKGLKLSGISSQIGYWKKWVTEGAYLFKKKIPAIGYGPGDESLEKPIGQKELNESILGQSAIIYRNIGFPVFGWADDEI